MSAMFKPCAVDGVRLAAYQNCAISMWNAASPADLSAPLAKQGELIEYVSARFREGPVFFVVIEAGTPVPNSTQRKALEAFYARWPWRAVAQIAEGTDLWSMTARSVMTGLRLIQRRSYPNRVFSEVAEGGQWVSEYVVREEGQSSSESVHALQRMVEDLRVLTA